MKEHNINIKTFESQWNVFEYDYFYSMFQKQLLELKNIDGIFTPDLGAICCLKIAQEKNIKIPQELKIVGYDGLSLSHYMNPELTTISQNIPLLAKTCIETLLNKIKGNTKIPLTQVLDVYFKKGFTT